MTLSITGSVFFEDLPYAYDDVGDNEEIIFPGSQNYSQISTHFFCIFSIHKGL